MLSKIIILELKKETLSLLKTSKNLTEKDLNKYSDYLIEAIGQEHLKMAILSICHLDGIQLLYWRF